MESCEGMGERMTEEPNILTMRLPKKNIIRETEDTIMIQIDDAKGFLEQLIHAFGNPNMAVVRKDEE